jgi:hypothetical protein
MYATLNAHGEAVRESDSLAALVLLLDDGEELAIDLGETYRYLRTDEVAAILREDPDTQTIRGILEDIGEAVEEHLAALDTAEIQAGIWRDDMLAQLLQSAR